MKRHQNIDPTDSNANQDTATTPKRMSGAKKLGVTAAFLAASGGAIAGGAAARVAHDNHERAADAASAAAAKKAAAVQLVDYRNALEGELKTAYVGPVAITSAENTGGTYVDPNDIMKQKRGVVSIHIGGSAINEKTAKSTGDPNYMYSKDPTDNLILPQGGKFPAEAHWVSTSDRGDVVAYPVLSNFDGSKPKTLDYEIDLVTTGYMPNGQEVDAIYDAGEFAVTGSNGEITGVAVVPRPEDTPAIKIVEPPQGESNYNPF